MRRGYFTPPVLIILAIIIFAVAILIAINTDLVKRIKKEPSPTPVSSPTLSPSPTTQQSSPTSDETANWKTYTNTKFNYSTMYPPNWTYKESGGTTFLLPPEAKNDGNSISIGVRDKNTPVNPVFIQYETIRTISLGNDKVEVLKAKNLASETYLAEVRKGDYYFKFSFGLNLDRKYDYVFNKILSTFQFLD